MPAGLSDGRTGRQGPIRVRAPASVPCAHHRGVEQFGQLAGLITRRSQVQILPPLLENRPSGRFSSWTPGMGGTTSRGIAAGSLTEAGTCVEQTVGVRGRVRLALRRPHRLVRTGHPHRPQPRRCRLRPSRVRRPTASMSTSCWRRAQLGGSSFPGQEVPSSRSRVCLAEVLGSREGRTCLFALSGVQLDLLDLGQ